MAESATQRAARFRAKAVELREHASTVSDPVARGEFIKLADEYERMAAQLEAMHRDFR